jgi:hypothetical protein
VNLAQVDVEFTDPLIVGATSVFIRYVVNFPATTVLKDALNPYALQTVDVTVNTGYANFSIPNYWFADNQYERFVAYLFLILR